MRFKTILLLSILFSGLSACTKEAEDDTNHIKNGTNQKYDDSYISYKGSYQTQVSLLLTKVKGWSTPTCLTCNGSAKLPEVSIGTNCIRDTYVSAAIQYAWAAESYYRLNEISKATTAANTMMEQLNVAKSLCSSGGIGIGGSTCKTFTIYPCP